MDLTKLIPNPQGDPAKINAAIKLLTQKEMSDMTQEDMELLRVLQPETVNPCDGCTLCCSAPAIDSSVILDFEKDFQPKPACETCEFVKDGGCGRYDTRPSVCRDYSCLYTMGVIDQNPKETGIAWTPQPLQNEQAGTLLCGHTNNAIEQVRSKHFKHILSESIRAGVFSAVTLRDDKDLISFDIESRAIFRAKVDPEDPMKQKILDGSEEQVTDVNELFANG